MAFDVHKAKAALPSVAPVVLDHAPMVRAYDTDGVTRWGHTHFFDCRWSFERGYLLLANA